MIKQTLAALIATSALSSAALAQTSAPPSNSCALPQIADTAPLERVAGSDLMTVPVVINGTTKQFLLDIGLKKPTSISPDLMAKLGIPESAYLTESITSGYGHDPAPAGGIGPGTLGHVRVYDPNGLLGAGALETHVRVSSFGVGNATGHHLQMMVSKKGEIGRSAPYDGYITGDFFRQYDVELDFAGKQITWLTATTCADPNQAVFWAHSEVAVMPVTLAKDGRYQMQATVGGHLINAELDTSSPQTVMRRDIAEQYVGLKANTPQMVPLADVKDGKGMQIYLATFPEITFAGGGVIAEKVPVMIQDYSMIPALDRETPTGRGAAFADERIPDLVIGMDVLQHLHMYVVPGLGRIYVTSTGKEDVTPN